MRVLHQSYCGYKFCNRCRGLCFYVVDVGCGQAGAELGLNWVRIGTELGPNWDRTETSPGPTFSRDQTGTKLVDFAVVVVVVGAGVGVADGR